MNKQIGLWIDHRKALIVSITGKTEEVKQISSGILEHIRFTGETPYDASKEDAMDRQFDNQMNKFFGDVIPYLREAESISIFGPGEAKKELETRLEKEGLDERIQGIFTMDKMTDKQIVAEIRRQVAY